jgi:hypothetical protein
MKRILLIPALLVSLGGLPAKATQFWYDVITNYPGGCITTNTADWFHHLPGSLTATDALIITNTYTSGAAVNGKRLRINGLNSEYIMRLFDPATTNVLYSGVVYASFIASANYVPAAGAGTYFASFDNADTNNPPQVYTNGFDFRGRISEIGATNVYPNTTRVGSCFQWGIANAAGDPAQGGLPSILFVPIDAVKNIDYQIVVKYDIDNAQATLWVNPASESDTGNMAGPTTDFGAVVNGLAGLLFRQRTGGGTVDIRDVVVGTTFADVMTNVASASPVLIANTFNTVTNYAGNPALLEVFATSLGGGPLSYQWYQVSGGVTNPVGGNSQTYLVSSLSGTDTGSYFCAITNSGGQGALSPSSAKFYISVNTTPTAPSFTSKPAASTNGTVGGSLSLAAPAAGTGPLTYTWAFNGKPLTDGQPVTGNPGDASVVSGSQTPNLTIGFMSTNETGTLTVTVTGGVAPAASTSVALTVNPARAVSIAYIRSLEDTNTWQVADTGSIFVVSNAVVTMFTNVTGGTTASYYVQDASGCGLDLFVTGDASFRPQMGDLVSFGGTLSMYNNAIETYPNGYPTTTGNKNLYVTNNSPGSVPLNVFLPGGTDTDLNNQTVQRFAYTITGVMAQFKSGAYANSGYELYVTRFGDIVTNPPPQVTDLKATVAGSDVVLTWTAVPYTIDTRGAYSYTVLASPDVVGPYLPLASLAFSTSAASFTHTNALSGTQMFYRISSP